MPRRRRRNAPCDGPARRLRSRRHACPRVPRDGRLELRGWARRRRVGRRSGSARLLDPAGTRVCAPQGATNGLNLGGLELCARGATVVARAAELFARRESATCRPVKACVVYVPMGVPRACRKRTRLNFCLTPSTEQLRQIGTRRRHQPTRHEARVATASGRCKSGRIASSRTETASRSTT